MKIELTERQKAILQSLCLKNKREVQTTFDELAKGRLLVSDIEELCTVINNEFMTEGILPSFEPNAYGLELEVLLDVVNRARISP
jgi:hypothetical protein